MRACLAYLRASSKITKGVVDGWGLIHVGLAAVRELEPDSWVKSFKRVNLNPHYRVSFADWCVRIESFLVGGQSFKTEKSATTTATLPPPPPPPPPPPYPPTPTPPALLQFLTCISYCRSFWRGMLPSEKEAALAILNGHDKQFSVQCVRDLSSKMHVPLKDMQHFRTCLELAMEDPSHIQRSPGDSLASISGRSRRSVSGRSG